MAGGYKAYFLKLQPIQPSPCRNKGPRDSKQPDFWHLYPNSKAVFGKSVAVSLRRWLTICEHRTLRPKHPAKQFRQVSRTSMLSLPFGWGWHPLAKTAIQSNAGLQRSAVARLTFWRCFKGYLLLPACRQHTSMMIAEASLHGEKLPMLACQSLLSWPHQCLFGTGPSKKPFSWGHSCTHPFPQPLHRFESANHLYAALCND